MRSAVRGVLSGGHVHVSWIKFVGGVWLGRERSNLDETVCTEDRREFDIEVKEVSRTLTCMHRSQY
jgi:hypothetical protein